MLRERSSKKTRRFPIITAVDIAVAEQGTFNITKLIEYEQGMITSITEMTVVSRPFLFSKGWTV